MLFAVLAYALSITIQLRYRQHGGDLTTPALLETLQDVQLAEQSYQTSDGAHLARGARRDSSAKTDFASARQFDSAFRRTAIISAATEIAISSGEIARHPGAWAQGMDPAAAAREGALALYTFQERSGDLAHDRLGRSPGSAKNMMVAATAPTGRFTQKIQRQPGPSVR